MARKYDVVLFGATGDAGRCVAHFLHNKGKSVGIKSWAPCARNLQKLEKTLAPILSPDRVVPPAGVGCAPPLRADSDDYASVLNATSQASVVITCAGPFAKYGESVVRACVESGTDYVDITGETPWVNEMAKTYGDEAEGKGVFVLSQAAYDSVPSDITVALAAKMLAGEGETIVKAETHHILKGGAMPVGTLNTMMMMVIEGRRKVLSDLTGGAIGGLSDAEKTEAAEKKKRRSVLKHVAGLVPTTVESAIARDNMWNMIVPYTSFSNSWSFPHFMAVANTPIVHTTAHKLGYGATEGRSFTYRERLQLGNNMRGDFVPFLVTVALGAIAAIVIIPVALPLFLFAPNVLLALLQTLNNSDFGNAKATIFRHLFDGYKPNCLTSVVAIASSASGKNTAKVTFDSDYDAGLGFTALSVVTVAGAVLEKREKGEKGSGFDTPVAAIGVKELSVMYERAGVRIHQKLNEKL